MSIHKLYIFAKNRDAVAAQKGYAFQQLKTLEDWIENRVANRDEIIYCDYEDDIFTRDITQRKSTFKQIKLYATDFSFSSEGLKKAVSHFFMLYVKGEYSFDQMEFSFETNASIVQRTVKDNDADLLQEWSENQHSLSDDLLRRIRIRVKTILDEYVNEAVVNLSSKIELKSEVQQAKIIYDGLKDEDMDTFIRCIKWQFDGTTQNLAVEQILARIEGLIPKIPIPLDDNKVQIYAALLVSEVYQRSIRDNPEDRKLTNSLLDSILLNVGDKEDQWYAGALDQFRLNGKVKFFFPGEFQSAISGARYCRWNVSDDGHKSFWIDILKQYFALDETPIENKRKAVYEYLFLKIGHNLLEQRTESAIATDLDLVKFYINHWEHRSNLRDIDDDIVLLQLLKAQIHRFRLPFSEEELLSWQESIEKFLNQEIQKESNIDRLCDLLELRGHLEKQRDILKSIESTKAAFEFYRKIPPLLNKAEYYSLARLYSQMDSIVKMLIQYDVNADLRDVMDEFMLEIQGYAQDTGLRHKAAHDLIERGSLYLKNQKPENYLKALELFHRAKNLWRLEYTKEGYVLSLLNISQVYSSLGMGYASKYYALLALWSTWNFSDPSQYKRLPQALGLICFSDFSHGAWISAISDFNLYLFVKREFDERGFEIDNDDIYQRTIFNISAIVHAVPLIHPEMSDLIESLKSRWSFIWEEQIEPQLQQISKRIKNMDELKRVLAVNLRDKPLNDVRHKRNIRFNALGIDWHIEFDNNETMAAIGEEFVSYLQIVLCEIARIDSHFFRNGQRVDILIQQGHFQKENLGKDKWVITIPKFDSKEAEEIQMHYVYLDALMRSIFESMTKLSKEDFKKLYFERLLLKEKLAEKVLEGTAYQRAFKSSIDTSPFETPDIQKFKQLADDNIPVVYRKYLAIETEL